MAYVAPQSSRLGGGAFDQCVNFAHALGIAAGGNELAQQLYRLFRELHMLLDRGDGR